MEKKNNAKAIVGVAWKRTKTDRDGNPYSFYSLAFTGNRDKDKFEIVMRRKSDGSELTLSDTQVIMVDNAYKKEDKHPDNIIKAYYEGDEEDVRESNTTDTSNKTS